MASIPPLGREAIEHARRGDFTAALASAQRALTQHGDDPGLRLFVGMLHSRRLEYDQALSNFRAAVALSPSDPSARLELARTLVALGEFEEAEGALPRPLATSRDGQRIRAAIHSRRGELADAIALLRGLVTGDPRDFESWSSLGIALLASGDPRGAVEALNASLGLRPDQLNVRLKWVEAQIAGGSGEQALTAASAELRQRASDTVLRIAVARLHELLGRPAEAMFELERATETKPLNPAALTALAELQERHNQVDAFAKSVAKLNSLSQPLEKLPLLEAQLAYRKRDFERALELVERAPPMVEPAARAQLIGNIKDRIGDSNGAWEAFAAMNADDARASADAVASARRYRSELDRQFESMTEEWAHSWTDSVPPERSPAFLFGFPRSGTTLLDTFLMGHPGACVSEENPLLPAVSSAAGDVATLPNIGEGQIELLRHVYWREAERFTPECKSGLLIDKFPFGLVAAPYARRLFPEARVILVERHPCDVVLSCYFTRFQPTGPAASFVDIVETAKLYDGMMRFWARSCELLKLTVHPVRYERLVENPEQELRSAAQFLKLDWVEALVDHRETASQRGFIKTPSYAQVSEPLYSRSIGRWTRYREPLSPVLDILEPWVRRLGYAL